MKLERMFEDYKNAPNQIKKEKILYDILKELKSYIYTIGNSYSKKYPMVPFEDITQMIHIGVWNGLENIRPGGYLMGSISNHIKRELNRVASYNKSKKRSAYTFSFDETISEGVSEEAFLDSKTQFETTCVTRMDLENAMSRLPKDLREILELTSKGLSWREISKLMNISKSSYYNKRKSAMIYIRNTMKGYDLANVRI